MRPDSTQLTKSSGRGHGDHSAVVVRPLPPLQDGVIVLDEVDVEVDRSVEGGGQVGDVREGGHPRRPNDLGRADLKESWSRVRIQVVIAIRGN